MRKYAIRSLIWSYENSALMRFNEESNQTNKMVGFLCLIKNQINQTNSALIRFNKESKQTNKNN